MYFYDPTKSLGTSLGAPLTKEILTFRELSVLNTLTRTYVDPHLQGLDCKSEP